MRIAPRPVAVRAESAVLVDANNWNWSIALTVVFIVAAMFYATCVYHWLGGVGWYTSIDMPELTGPGLNVFHGRLHDVYSQNRGLYALPLSFFVIAPVAGLVEHLHLPTSPNQDSFLIMGPFFLSFGVFVLHAARSLAWDLGRRHRLWLVQVTATIVVLVPAFEWGHIEDVLALAFVLYSVRRLVTGDPVRAALWLSLAISSKQWAVMLIPVFVLAAPKGQRLRIAAFACALPAALALLFLGIDFKHALDAFTSPVTSVNGDPGHPWIDGTWLGSRSSQVNRTAAVLLAAGVAWRRRARVLPLELVCTVGLILLIRPLTEVVNYSYYWSPGLLLLALVALGSGGRTTPGDWALPALAIMWTLPRSNDLTALLWWAGEATLLVLLAARVARADRFGRRVPCDAEAPTPA